MRKRDFERRGDARVADGIIQVEYVAPSPRVRDLSTSGLYLKDSRTLQMGQMIELKLRIGEGEPIIIYGMVRRVDPGEGMAIEIIRLDAAARRRIKEFISHADPDKISPADEFDV